MTSVVVKAPKIALCRVCHGTGCLTRKDTDPASGPQERVCPQCGGSGRVTVSGRMELDIRPYNPKKRK